jgi:hypothetical protein
MQLSELERNAFYTYSASSHVRKCPLIRHWRPAFQLVFHGVHAQRR